jgi:hypothetical protein
MLTTATAAAVPPRSSLLGSQHINIKISGLWFVGAMRPFLFFFSNPMHNNNNNKTRTRTRTRTNPTYILYTEVLWPKGQHGR